MDLEHECGCEEQPCDCTMRSELVTEHLSKLGIFSINDAPAELLDEANKYADEIIAAGKR